MNITITEHNTVIDGLFQELELQHRQLLELQQALQKKDVLLQLSRRECDKHFIHVRNLETSLTDYSNALRNARPKMAKEIDAIITQTRQKVDSIYSQMSSTEVNKSFNG